MASRHEKTDAEKKVEGDIAKMDLYGLLEVEADATEKVILKAYRYVKTYVQFSNECIHVHVCTYLF